jgi:hypothetical protein
MDRSVMNGDPSDYIRFNSRLGLTVNEGSRNDH